MSVILKSGMNAFETTCDFIHNVQIVSGSPNNLYIVVGKCVVFSFYSNPKYHPCSSCIVFPKNKCQKCVRGTPAENRYIPVGCVRDKYIYTDADCVINYSQFNSTITFFRWFSFGVYYPITITSGFRYDPYAETGEYEHNPSHSVCCVVWAIIAFKRWKNKSPTAMRNRAVCTIQRTVRKWAIRQLAPNGRLYNQVRTRYYNRLHGILHDRLHS